MKDHYFTTEHEWIDFQGAVAYIGVCNYKVSKLKTIEKIVFPKASGIKKKGDVLAVIYTKTGRIPVHMPVDGKILNLKNKGILTDLENFLQQSEKDRWLAFIGLSQPYERKGLMQIDQYKHFIKKGS
ncbi:MAG TPA: hypothetical protein VNS50_07960 [Ginsengibacter sp.]|nr:hypothetical protein [Ginsengibacter sp.]